MKCNECGMNTGHKMDCQGGFNYVRTPAILSVKDEKHHIISHTVVDYERIEQILSNIKELLERNNWRWEITVPPSENYFKSELRIKDDLVKSGLSFKDG
jgi:hypothetical protein